MNPYGYDKIATPANVHLVETKKRWLRYTVDFPTAHPTKYPEFNTVRGLYYQPLYKESMPLAILVHGMGDYSALPWRFFAPSLARRGIACFLLYLPFHSTRMPEVIRSRMPKLTAEEWLEGYQLSVIDIRQVMDWASDRPEIRNEEIAVLGISYGGFVSAIAMGIDTRIKAGVFVVAGGNHVKMNWLSKSKAYNSNYHRTEAEYLNDQRIYAEYLTQVEQNGFENVEPADPAYFIDPMTFAVYLRQRPILMLNAKKDKYISPQAVLDFWQACGKPKMKWVPSGHISIWFWYPFVAQWITSFLFVEF